MIFNMKKYLYLSTLIGSLVIAAEPDLDIIDLDTITKACDEKPNASEGKKSKKKVTKEVVKDNEEPATEYKADEVPDSENKKPKKSKVEKKAEQGNEDKGSKESEEPKSKKKKSKKSKDSSDTKNVKDADGEPSAAEKAVLNTIAKYPDIAAGLIQQGVQAKQAQERVIWAKKVKENLSEITEKSIKFIADETGTTVLMFVDFLCPHCKEHLKSISDLRKKQPKLNFMIYSVPLFEGDLSREYGMIMNAAFKKDSTKFTGLLDKYGDGENSKENLLEKVKEFKIKIDTDSIKDLSGYDDRKTLMEKIGFNQVPVSFILLDDKMGGKIVVPIPIMAPDQLVKAVEDLNKTSSEQRAKLKKEQLGQD